MSARESSGLGWPDASPPPATVDVDVEVLSSIETRRKLARARHAIEVLGNLLRTLSTANDRVEPATLIRIARLGAEYVDGTVAELRS